jgi:predicted  nucleic acid-binding Zn-ribbon protein
MNGVRAEAEAIPARRAEIDAGVAEAKRAYEAEKSRLEDNERERRQIESLLQMERDKVKKWEGRLGEIKTPREYAALSREIDIAKKTNETQSEQLRTLAAAAQEIAKTVEAAADAFSERELAATDELAALEKKAADFTTRLKELEVRRADAAKRVEPALLSKYENIKRRRAGIAVAPVVGSTCRGCNRNIPPQLSIVLRRADSVETCPNCHRIIYSAEALNPPAPNAA